MMQMLKFEQKKVKAVKKKGEKCRSWHQQQVYAKCPSGRKGKKEKIWEKDCSVCQIQNIHCRVQIYYIQYKKDNKKKYV